MVSIELDDQTAEKLSSLAAERGLSVTDYLRTLVATQPGEAVPSVLDFDADLDDLLHDGPSLSADFSRDDIYAQHD